MKYAEKYGVSRASRKYNRSRSDIYFWKARWDETPEYVMRKLGMFPPAKETKPYKPKSYEQMTCPGERVQVDVRVVPRRCIAGPELRLFQYTAIEEFTRLRFLL